jgi:arginyl-tRNA synthetase
MGWGSDESRRPAELKLLDIGETEAVHELSVGDLTAFYQAARSKFDGDPGFVQRSRLRVVALQRGDELTQRLWGLLVAESQRYFLAVYAKLGVTLSDTHFYPESFYNPQQASRLVLCGLTLVRGLDLLAIAAPERM